MSEIKENGVLLEVKRLKKYFKTKRGPLHAVDDVSFTIERGKTLGVVGESGCGKSTLGRVILGLLETTAGEIWFDGQEITHAKGKRWKNLRKDMQIIFQDPMASLNPRFTVTDCIAEPLKIFGICKNKTELNERIYELMQTVGLDDRLAGSYPHELDGGRRQRIGVARALALMPKFIVCDEPVSALDVSIQAQILNLLQDLQVQNNLTYIFITHDMSVVKHISDDILVMYLGCMVEKSGSKELFRHQLHPYTKGLLSAIPIPDITVQRKKVIMQGELSSPINPKPGCRFANRCPYAKDKCHVEQPSLKEELPGHLVACHYCREINGLD
ncbi:MAG: ATP-binding cassette domain-containing protein [Peptococcaceae bacterium]|jgi:peptide/nickel transport system ATP-binding protein|nr:ATP-binding cassette domain-containing protein [Peptococcaceae bacterium]MDH7524460.1 ATP-binding cassette domain-containing protein [Peptococcaceae bacterium]